MRAEKWQRQRDSYRGYCTACRKWTRDMTEPDAEEYDCPICGCDSVMGAETALMSGVVEIDGE